MRTWTYKTHATCLRACKYATHNNTHTHAPTLLHNTQTCWPNNHNHTIQTNTHAHMHTHARAHTRTHARTRVCPAAAYGLLQQRWRRALGFLTLWQRLQRQQAPVCAAHARPHSRTDGGMRCMRARQDTHAHTVTAEACHHMHMPVEINKTGRQLRSPAGAQQQRPLEAIALTCWSSAAAPTRGNCAHLLELSSRRPLEAGLKALGKSKLPDMVWRLLMERFMLACTHTHTHTHATPCKGAGASMVGGWACARGQGPGLLRPGLPRPARAHGYACVSASRLMWMRLWSSTCTALAIPANPSIVPRAPTCTSCIAHAPSCAPAPTLSSSFPGPHLPQLLQRHAG